MNTTHTPGQTPFMFPFQTVQLGFRTFELRDAAGHLIGTFNVHDSVVEVEGLARLIAAAPEMRDELSEVLDLLRSIIDSGALKNVPHLPALLTDVMLSEAHERIANTRALLARIDGGAES